MGESRMSLNNEFTELISMELEKKNKNVAMLYDYLVEFKQKGMDQKSMLMNLERLRYQNVLRLAASLAR